MAPNETQHNDYDRHDIILRDVADATDPRCPDTLDGCIVVSYRTTHRPNSTFTESRAVSTRLPREMLALFDGGVLPVDELDSDERAWLRVESDRHSNAIDFNGTEAGA